MRGTAVSAGARGSRLAPSLGMLFARTGGFIAGGIYAVKKEEKKKKHPKHWWLVHQKSSCGFHRMDFISFRLEIPVRSSSPSIT